MKIVHVITRLILGGAQENTLLTCREQARLGHDVTLLAGPPEGPEGSLVEAARAMPIRFVLVPPLVRAVDPWHDLEAYLDLAKHFRDIHPDVVHTHSSKAGILGRLAARRAGVPRIVHTIHGLPFDEYQGRAANGLYRALERRAARWSHRLIAVSADMADRARAAGLAPRDRIAVVYSALDTEPFRAAAGRRDAVRQAWGAGPEDFVFLKVARLFPLKGHEFVLPAFAEVVRRHPRALLVLAGDGVLRPVLEAMAARLGVSAGLQAGLPTGLQAGLPTGLQAGLPTGRQAGVAARVRFLGLLAPEEMPGALWAADAVVHAGLREGLARVLPQAGLCERPVVAYDIGGAREVVRDGENGFLLPAPLPRDVARAAWPRKKGGCPLSHVFGKGGCTLFRGRAAKGTVPFSQQREKGTAPFAGAVAALAAALDRLAADPAAARAMGERWPADVLARFDCRAATAEIMRV
jgi:glycosyltransferase involved in cell wall biosynthesis